MVSSGDTWWCHHHCPDGDTDFEVSFPSHFCHVLPHIWNFLFTKWFLQNVCLVMSYFVMTFFNRVRRGLFNHHLTQESQIRYLIDENRSSDTIIRMGFLTLKDTTSATEFSLPVYLFANYG